MPGFNTLPSVGGGGGQANMTYVASVHMETYNRSWAQGGTPGYYAVYSTNQEQGYAYFTGSTTTGIPLNRLVYVSHSFTTINLIGMTNDMLSLYKAKVKSTTVFPNPFANFISFPALHTGSGNFVLPNAALPLVNTVIVGPGGPGGHGEHNGGGGGGGGGGVLKLTAFPASGTTSVVIGSHYGGANGATSTNKTYFGSVWAIAGGGGGHSRGHSGGVGANSGGSTHNNTSPDGYAASSGVGTGGFAAHQYHGGFKGGQGSSGNNHHSRGGGGGGAGGNGNHGSQHGNNGDGSGGIGHVSDIEGANHSYGPGGGGAEYNTHGPNGNQGYSQRGNGGRGGQDGQNHIGGADGAVIVRYYIP